MSRGFAWFGLLFSAFLLFIGLTSSTPNKPYVIVFWIIVGLFCCYKLFFKK